MVNVLTTKEYKAISKPKKERCYEVAYWNKAGTYFENQFFYATNANKVYGWLYSLDFKPFTVKFLGWR